MSPNTRTRLAALLSTVVAAMPLLGSAPAHALETDASQLPSWSDSLGVESTSATRPTQAFAVSNPYFRAGDTRARIRTLRVFGDSYSDIGDDRNGNTYDLWNEQLVVAHGLQGRGSLQEYAIWGSSARSVGVNAAYRTRTFKNQIDSFLAGGTPAWAGRDLTVVYLGYNDVQFFSDLGASRRDYQAGVDRLIQAGATGGRRRLFLALPHDWGKTPGQLAAGTGAVATSRMVQWNTFVRNLAFNRTRVVPVDLFTAFKVVRSNAADYGFSSVTQVGAATNPRFLYRDNFHFGRRGHELIEEVFAHYLNRGWDWSNTLRSAPAMTAQLREDISDGIVFNLAGSDPEAPVRGFLVGDVQSAASGEFDDYATDIRALHQASAPDAGAGFTMRLDPDTSIGLVASRYGEERDAAGGLGGSALDSTGLTVFVDRAWRGLELRTTFTQTDDDHSRSAYARQLDRSGTAEFGGSTTMLSQEVAYPMQFGGFGLAPSVTLSHTMQSVDGYTLRYPYLQEESYSGASIAESAVRLGLSGWTDPVALDDGRSVRFFADAGWTLGFGGSDYEVQVSEGGAAPITETIERVDTNLVSGRVGFSMDLGNAMSLDANYAVSSQVSDDVDQAVRMGFRWRF